MSDGEFSGSDLDHRDGFIHLSSRKQVAGTLERHFAGVADLVIVEIDANAIAASVRWEVSRGGELFPHLYGRLPRSAVVGTFSSWVD